MNCINTIVLILGVLIGMLFGCGITDWHILLKDEYKITDWIVAVCTILIVIGTLLAACYAKQSADYAKKQFLANNLPLAEEIYLGVIEQLSQFSDRLNERCSEIRNFVNERYDPIMTILNIVPQIEKSQKELVELNKKIAEQKHSVLFVMQNQNFNLATAPLFMLELHLNTFLDLYKRNPKNLDSLKTTAKQILDCNDQLIAKFSPIRKFFKHYFYQ